MGCWKSRAVSRWHNTGIGSPGTWWQPYPSSGNRAFDFTPLAFVAASLTMPVYGSVPIRDGKVVEAFLAKPPRR